MSETRVRSHGAPRESVHQHQTQPEAPALAPCIRVGAGAACKVLSVLLMNQALFPLFDDVFTYTRDVSITFCALVLVSVAVAAMWRPRVLRPRRALAVLAALAPLAFAGVACAMRLGSVWLLVPFACAAVTCRSLTALTVDLAAVSLLAGRMVVSVAAGMLAGYALDTAFVQCGLGAWAGTCLAVVVLPWLELALCGGRACALADAMAAAEPVAELSVTRPASFLPLTSTLYMFQFVACAAFGFTLRFGEVGGSPAFGTGLASIALAALLALTLLRRGRLSLDGLCNVVILALLAGMMLAAVHTASGARFSTTVLTVGNALCSVFVMCVLVLLAGRNRLAALPIFAWANGFGSLGTTLGALVGTTANGLIAQGSPEVASYVVIAFAVLYVGYGLFWMRSYSFHDEIATVEEPLPAGTSQGVPPAGEEHSLEERCHALAQLHGLTPREEETFAMLARGRNREYIENALQVSRNTVKAHVKHVYAKLGIHSHQELLDLVEAADAAGVPGVR